MFYVVVLITAVVLLVVSFNKKNRNYAIVAEVEPQKTAVSFPKPVRIKTVMVQPGAHVKKGDLLLEVERPDLLLDVQKINNALEQLEAEMHKLQEDYQARDKVDGLRHRQQVSALDRQIKELETKYRSDSLFYAEVTRWSGSDSTVDKNVYYLRLKSLREERSLEVDRYASEKARQETLYAAEAEALALRRLRLRDEANSLQTEEEGLKQYAPFDGTIGSVSVQLMELIPPYQTILSVYDENPNIIRAYMNEQATITINVGEKVAVESINRPYAIDGEIIEVGSRIVSYPRQMTGGQEIQMWGKEIFVRIPEENTFLNGEKVYVIIDPK